MVLRLHRLIPPCDLTLHRLCCPAIVVASGQADIMNAPKSNPEVLEEVDSFVGFAHWMSPCPVFPDFLDWP